MAQQHRPDDVEGHVYYEPSTHGAEADLVDRVAQRRQAREAGS